ncbi:hypothetical protein KIPB_013556, partial [Kipferlia bialata]
FDPSDPLELSEKAPEDRGDGRDRERAVQRAIARQRHLEAPGMAVSVASVALSSELQGLITTDNVGVAVSLLDDRHTYEAWIRAVTADGTSPVLPAMEVNIATKAGHVYPADPGGDAGFAIDVLRRLPSARRVAVLGDGAMPVVVPFDIDLSGSHRRPNDHTHLILELFDMGTNPNLCDRMCECIAVAAIPLADVLDEELSVPSTIKQEHSNGRRNLSTTPRRVEGGVDVEEQSDSDDYQDHDLPDGGRIWAPH